MGYEMQWSTGDTAQHPSHDYCDISFIYHIGAAAHNPTNYLIIAAFLRDTERERTRGRERERCGRGGNGAINLWLIYQPLLFTSSR